MSSVKTRRQTAAASTPSTPTPAAREQVIMNGNASAQKPQEEDYPRENIFLFWPNVIGELDQMQMWGVWRILIHGRIFSNCARIGLPLLHAPSSTHLYSLIQYFVSSRCSRWIRRPGFRAIYKIWCGIGYGHRSMYHSLLARLPLFGLASMGPSLPRTHIVGSG